MKSTKLGVAIAATVGMVFSLQPLVAAPFSVLLGPVSDSFGWGRGTMSMGLLAQGLISTAGFPLVGILVDRWGARRVILVGLALMGAAIAALSCLNGSVSRLVLLFLIVGAAGSFPTGIAYAKILSATFVKARGTILNLCLGGGGGIGIAVMPQLAHFLLRQQWDWRSVYLTIGLLTLMVALPIVFLFLKEPPGLHRTATEAAVQGGLADSSLISALRTRTLWIMVITVFLSCGVTAGLSAHVVPLLVDRGNSIGFSTNVISVFALAITVGQCSSGFLMDRIADSRISTPFFLIILVGLLIFNYTTAQPAILIGMALIGAGIGMVYGVMPYYVTRFFGLSSFAGIYGVIYAAAAIAGGIAPAILGYSYDRIHTYGPALTAFELSLGAAVIISALLGPYRHAISKEPDMPGEVVV